MPSNRPKIGKVHQENKNDFQILKLWLCGLSQIQKVVRKSVKMGWRVDENPDFY